MQHFGIVAEQIDYLKIGSTNYPLNAGPGNDDLPLGSTGNFNARETNAFANSAS